MCENEEGEFQSGWYITDEELPSHESYHPEPKLYLIKDNHNSS